MDREEYDKAFNQALRFLAPRFLSRFELLQKLMTKGYSRSCSESVIDKLEELGYVDDERLQQGVLRIFMEEARYGKYYIEQKMRKRGLIPDPEVLASYDEYASAHNLAIKQFPLDKGPYDSAKIIRYLKNRGYSQSTIFEVLSLYTSDIM